MRVSHPQRLTSGTRSCPTTTRPCSSSSSPATRAPPRTRSRSSTSSHSSRSSSPSSYPSSHLPQPVCQQYNSSIISRCNSKLKNGSALEDLPSSPAFRATPTALSSPDGGYFRRCLNCRFYLYAHKRCLNDRCTKFQPLYWPCRNE